MALSILGSLAVAVFTVVYFGGLSATPDGTLDSAGREMGFNKPFSPEHHRIVLSHATFARTWAATGWYQLVLLAMQGVAMAAALRVQSRRWLTRFFLVQFLIFPFGVLGMLPAAHALGSVAFTGTVETDLEGLIDVPHLPELVSQGTWWLVCGLGMVLLRFPQRPVEVADGIAQRA